MEQILLNDLLGIEGPEFEHAKVKFNQHNSWEDPLDLYQNDPEIVNTQWFLWHKKQRYFTPGQLAICFLKLSEDSWLLTTIKRITKTLDVCDDIGYEAEELTEYSKFFGRVIVSFHKKRAQGYWYKNICDDLVVNQILPVTFDGDDFPGYDRVRLTFGQIETIIKRNKRDWVSALSNQKAVYLIIDTETGQMYVGMATSDKGMLLDRWRSYVENGHGGNVELKKLVEEKGFDYVKKNFVYSILESYNATIDDRVIGERETWWKQMLLTRKFGYNKN